MAHSLTRADRALRDTLAQAMGLEDPYARANAVTQALGWNQAGTEVEWTPVAEHLGHLALGGFPTSAAIVTSDHTEPLWAPAWHAGARWCLATEQDKLQWFDLQNRLAWTGRIDELRSDVLEGLRPLGFAQSGRFEPRHVTPLLADEIGHDAPNVIVTDRIERWWMSYIERHARPNQSAAENQEQKDEFTRFIAGILFLRTIEDLNHVKWLPRQSLRRCSNQTKLDTLVGQAAYELNTRVLQGISSIPFDLARTMIEESYELGVDFSALDVDPVGAFYEEILGVDLHHEEKVQRSLFGHDTHTSKDRNARRAKGVYYTPRIYANTLARMTVRPRARTAEHIDELPVVADIAAGSGELLCAALREILFEPAWCKPEIAWQVLDSKIQALDENPFAAQLCALNLLRTAIRHVPELLTVGRRLPALKQNLRGGDALKTASVDDIPAADVVLINPPFHGPNYWPVPEPKEAIPELLEVPSHPNQALAFFAAAIRIAKPGASLGVVMPSRLFDGPRSAAWRAWIAERVRLDMVVSNLGTPFRDVHSYAGFVVGKKMVSPTQWRPRSRIVQIHGLVQGEEWDTGVLLAETGERRGVVASHVIAPLNETSPNWIGKTKKATTATRRASLLEVFGDSFHQGVVLAPALWTAKLFLFRDESPQSVKHEWSGTIVKRSALLRPFVNAKKVTRRCPLWCNPEHVGLWAFVPPGRLKDWFDITSLRDTDPASHRMGKLVVDSILKCASRASDAGSEKFVEHAQSGQLRIHAPKHFENNRLPLICAAKASVTIASRNQGRSWYAWVNLEGNVVPASGLQLRAPRPELAAALVAWMSLDICIESLVGSPLLGGSKQFNQGSLAAWPIPDLREDRLQPRLDELYAAFLAYREEATRLRPKEALQLNSYREVQDLALALWKDG